MFGARRIEAHCRPLREVAKGKARMRSTRRRLFLTLLRILRDSDKTLIDKDHSYKFRLLADDEGSLPTRCCSFGARHVCYKVLILRSGHSWAQPLPLSMWPTLIHANQYVDKLAVLVALLTRPFSQHSSRYARACNMYIHKRFINRH